MKMSYHCEVQRKNRVENIVANIGIGQIVREKYVHTPQQIMQGQAGRYICITDTGITIIKSEDKLKIITMYVTTYRELLSIFGSQKSIPTYLHKKVDRNQSHYIQKGKTIWK